MDDIATYNQKRWKALAAANALFTRPKADLSVEDARAIAGVENANIWKGKQVLCLAGGGGQQSVVYGLLGAAVTVVDLSAEQLERDRLMAKHHQLSLTIVQADMRDLSQLASDTFDYVIQPYSLNFVPDVTEVFAQVAYVIKPQGRYEFMCANPFAAGVKERDWNGKGYTVKRPYQQGERITTPDQDWVYDREQHGEIPPPVEYRQTLSTLINGLVNHGFVIQHLQEIMADAVNIAAEPGTWDHFTAVLPPWLTIRAVYHPELFSKSS